MSTVIVAVVVDRKMMFSRRGSPGSLSRSLSRSLSTKIGTKIATTMVYDEDRDDDRDNDGAAGRAKGVCSGLASHERSLPLLPVGAAHRGATASFTAVSSPDPPPGRGQRVTYPASRAHRGLPRRTVEFCGQPRNQRKSFSREEQPPASPSLRARRRWFRPAPCRGKSVEFACNSCCSRFLQNPSRRSPAAVAARGSVRKYGAAARISVNSEVLRPENGRFLADFVFSGFRNRAFRWPCNRRSATRSS